ncbi:lysophospholipid acyltransferase family protein [Paenibacillus sp. y28]|uniref:lysophospholipid acyltransferase family protein n=1 Tax=Paenibacillus sp. y28 TaxID=3129110 RepID=UPI00301A1D8F
MYNWIGQLTQGGRGIRFAAAAAGFMPKPIAFGMCWTIARLLYTFAGRQIKERIRRNLTELLELRHSWKLKEIEKDYFLNLAVTLYELLLESQAGQPGLCPERIRTEGEHHLQDALTQGKGAIVFAPHSGNFFYYYLLLTRRYSCMTVVTAGSPELRPIYEQFGSFGCRGLDYDHTPPLELVRTLRKHLQAGGVVFLLGDFYREAFPEAEFFGKRSRSPGGTAMLALAEEAPVIPCHGYRNRMFRHRLIFEQPRFLNREFATHERETATNSLNRWLERVIREHPAGWFYWFNADERFASKQIV